MPRAAVSRRSFLETTAVAALTAPLLHANEKRKPPVVDAHLHCFAGKDDKRFPYHERAAYKPPVAATPEMLLKLMDGAGVDFAVVIHPEPYQDDHRYLEHCLQVGGKRLKGTALVFADRPGSVDQLPGLVKKLGVVAARIHAYAPERLPPFGKPELRALWKKAADLGIAVQLHFEPRYAAGFEPLIKEFKETRIIIDHLGRPFQGSPKEHAVVVGWSRCKNVVMKLSAIPEDRMYPHRDVKPIVKELADAYGADRLLYGGGFDEKATAQSYRAARERVRSLLAHFSEADQAKVLGGNAAGWFGFA